MCGDGLCQLGSCNVAGLFQADLEARFAFVAAPLRRQNPAAVLAYRRTQSQPFTAQFAQA
jgi:hypothetical protein